MGGAQNHGLLLTQDISPVKPIRTYETSSSVQLDLFIPIEYGYEYKVIVFNKRISAKKILILHNGRGSQESVFGELKTQSQLDYIAVNKLSGNQFYMMAAILAHNLNRELQMITKDRDRGTTEKRSPLWNFQGLKWFRHRYIQRAGRLTAPRGNLTLAMNGNEAVKKGLFHFLQALKLVA
jgi:hypothetical protein